MIARLQGVYGRALEFTLHHRGVFVLVIVGLLWGSIHLFGTIERSFSSRSEERRVTILVDTPRQYSLEQTRALYEEVYEIVDTRREELDIADISYAFDRGTGRSRGGWRGGRRIEIFLVDESEAQLTTARSAGQDSRPVADQGGCQPAYRAGAGPGRQLRRVGGADG